MKHATRAEAWGGAAHQLNVTTMSNASCAGTRMRRHQAAAALMHQPLMASMPRITFLRARRDNNQVMYARNARRRGSHALPMSSCSRISLSISSCSRSSWSLATRATRGSAVGFSSSLDALGLPKKLRPLR